MYTCFLLLILPFAAISGILMGLAMTTG
jgi:hypothetical protein